MKHTRAMLGLAALVAFMPLATHAETVTPALAPVSNGSMSAAGSAQTASVGTKSQAGFDHASWCRRIGRSANLTEGCLRAVR